MVSFLDKQLVHVPFLKSAVTTPANTTNTSSKHSHVWKSPDYYYCGMEFTHLTMGVPLDSDCT